MWTSIDKQNYGLGKVEMNKHQTPPQCFRFMPPFRRPILINAETLRIEPGNEGNEASDDYLYTACEENRLAWTADPQSLSSYGGVGHFGGTGSWVCRGLSMSSGFVWNM
jgi:hypothetical protein